MRQLIAEISKNWGPYMILYHRAISLFRDSPKLMAIAGLWAMLWLSINGESAIGSEGFFASLHMGRLLFPYVAASLALLWLLYLRVKPKIELWQFALIGYAGFILCRGIFLGIPLIALHFHAAILCAIILVILCDTLITADDAVSLPKVMLTLLMTNIGFLCALLLAFFSRDVLLSMTWGAVSGYMSHGSSTTVVGMESPRPTGVSRLAAVAILFIFAAFMSGFLRTRLAKLLIYFGMAVIIYYQSRGTGLALLAVGLILLMVLPRQNWPKLGDIAKFFAGTLVAWAVLTAIILLGIILIREPTTVEVVYEHGAECFDTKKSSDENCYRQFINTVVWSRELVPAEVGSGRLRLWDNGWRIFLEKPFFGLGGQADRFHMDQNASNMFIYILMCGGLVGAFFAAIAVARALQTVWTSIKIKHEGLEKTERFFLLSSLTIFAFLSARGLVENSYALFNVDFLLAIPAIWYLSSKSNEPARSRQNR